MLYPRNTTWTGLVAGPDAPRNRGGRGVCRGYNASVIRPSPGAQAFGILVLADSIGTAGDGPWRGRS